ncbi:MAG TPA: RNA-binding domain-containing protein [Bryobacterales bacterium]|nr:RNA-binding domain-containing protein [Bryobacterales bacterium]
MLDTLESHIADRDARAILHLMFARNPLALRDGFYKEEDLWDFKEDLPPVARGSGEESWAGIAADVLALHNTRGGVLLFGIRNSTFEFVGATQRVDTKIFNDKIRRYVGDRFWVSFSREFIQQNQRYLGVAIVPPKAHAPLRAMADSPSGKLKVGDLCVRVGDETRILRGTDAIEFARQHRVGPGGTSYEIDEPCFRILRPDYRHFISRGSLCDAVSKGLASDRTFVTSLAGIGGVGKTALACWATLDAYQRKQFDFIVSVTAKDRALTSAGIVPFAPTLSSLTDLLREICEVTGFSEFEDLPHDEQLRAIRQSLLCEFKGLLLVDNLETVDDPRIIQFLEQLPLPTRAIVTSRKARVRVAVQPVDVGPFEEGEAVEFLNSIARSVGKHFLADMSAAEKTKIVKSCDLIPLVIEWFVGRAKTPERAIQAAETLVSQSKHGEELVEFSFRRVYEELAPRQQAVLKVLSLIGRPLPVEAIAAGADLAIHEVADELEEIKSYSLVERQYDPSYRDIVHSLLPVTNTFVYREIAKHAGYEGSVRKRLNDWYQANEIVDPAQRQLVQKVRRGERNPELTLLEVARNFLSNGELDKAEEYFKLGLERNARSWQLHRELAEFYRHQRCEVAGSLRHYELAAENAPARGPDRVRIFREYGVVLRDSGLSSAFRDAAEKFKVALAEAPMDAVCRHALGDCYVKMGAFQPALEVLKPLETNPSPKTRAKTYPLLERCYRELHDLLGLATLRARMAEDGAAAAQATAAGSLH